MHCQDELLTDLQYKGFLPDETLLKWCRDRYSTSKHLLPLFSIPVGLGAETIVEIGFGRSSFALAKSANEIGASFITCDIRDFSYLLNSEEKKVSTFVHGKSDLVWGLVKDKGIDFAFLDYFSGETIGKTFILSEIKKCISLMKQNGIIAIHDAIDNRYNVKQALKSLASKSLFVNSGVEVISLPYNYGLGLIRVTRKSKYGMLKDMHLKK